MTESTSTTQGPTTLTEAEREALFAWCRERLACNWNHAALCAEVDRILAARQADADEGLTDDVRVTLDLLDSWQADAEWAQRHGQIETGVPPTVILRLITAARLAARDDREGKTVTLSESDAASAVSAGLAALPLAGPTLTEAEWTAIRKYRGDKRLRPAVERIIAVRVEVVQALLAAQPVDADTGLRERVEALADEFMPASESHAGDTTTAEFMRDLRAALDSAKETP